MWADVETNQDFLNYGELAEVVAGMLCDPRMLPLSVGVSGSWGTGKSSMLRLIEAKLQAEEGLRAAASQAPGSEPAPRFIVVRYDAWLYQGYDDARAALMETIATRLMAEAESEPETVKQKAVGLFRRVNKLRLLGLAADGALMAAGVPTMGGISKGLGALGKLWQGQVDADEATDLREAAKEGGERLKGMLRPEEKATPPRQVEEFRTEFAALLDDLNAVLVVFIDNLDRCLPPQVIHTLEALRLFLFMGNSAFVVAADEDMVRHSVGRHFEGIGGDHVRDYLDKLIQVPVRVPRLGVPEITSYLMLLFAGIHPDVPAAKLDVLQKDANRLLQEAWKGEAPTALAAAKLVADPPSQGLLATFEMAERMAPLLTSCSAINGNPRVIKRLLNTVRIRAKLAAVRRMPADETVIAKLALFERVMGEAAAISLYSEILTSVDGASARLQAMQNADEDGFRASCPAEWQGGEKEEFLRDWVKLEPLLGGEDLRRVSALSRDTIAMLGRRRGLSEAAAVALKILAAVARLPSPNADSVARAVPAEERAAVLGVLLTAMRRHADWSTQPPEYNGSYLLARQDDALWHELQEFLKAKGGAKPAPWLASALRTTFLKEVRR